MSEANPATRRVIRRLTPGLHAADFAHFLSHVPGCFAFIGNGVDAPPLHNPSYDFDDANLLGGARFHAAIARRRLA